MPAWKKFRCKSSHGLSCQWSIGQKKNGRWKIMSLGDIKRGRRPMPVDFAPFELMNVVINGPDFATEAEVRNFVRSL
jgi:hypothetical protein